MNSKMKTFLSSAMISALVAGGTAFADHHEEGAKAGAEATAGKEASQGHAKGKKAKKGDKKAKADAKNSCGADGNTCGGEAKKEGHSH